MNVIPLPFTVTVEMALAIDASEPAAMSDVVLIFIDSSSSSANVWDSEALGVGVVCGSCSTIRQTNWMGRRSSKE